jgi:dTMP kinase
METEGANAEAVAAVAAQERLINVKAENAVKAEMARRSEEEAKKDEERSEYRRKQAEDAARLAEEKRKAQQVASQEIEDIQSLIVIAKEQDQLRENELQLEMKLRDIRRDRKELTEQIGAEAARNLMLAREELAIVNAEQRAKEITAKREQEAQKAEADALKEELRQRQDMLKALDKPMSLTQSIQTSIGGSFTVANSSVQSAMKSIAERQSTLQQQIKELVERISQQVSGMQGGLA